MSEEHYVAHKELKSLPYSSALQEAIEIAKQHQNIIEQIEQISQITEELQGYLPNNDRHIKGPMEKARIIELARRPHEEYDLLPIDGVREFDPDVRRIRCDTLTLQDGAELILHGGRLTNHDDPLADMIIIAARNLLIRTPGLAARITIIGQEAPPAPRKAANGANGGLGGNVGSHGTPGKDGEDGTDGRLPGLLIMNQVAFVFDNIEDSDPGAPTVKYPKLEITALGARGRDGGPGGDGGRGGDGMQGSKSVVTLGGCKAGPGRGGNGGRGGDAGDGGDGENGVQGHNIILASTTRAIQKASGFKYALTGGPPGIGGEPGLAGRGGGRGRRGQESFPCKHWGNRNGKAGSMGSEGNEGIDGVNGEEGRVLYQYLSDAEFASVWN